jgi:ribosomal protein L18E
MSKKKSTTRMKIRKMQRESQARINKKIAKLMNMPKSLRQYFARLGNGAESIMMEYRKYKV